MKILKIIFDYEIEENQDIVNGEIIFDYEGTEDDFDYELELRCLNNIIDLINLVYGKDIKLWKKRMKRLGAEK